MKKITCLVILCALMGLCCAQAAPATSDSGLQLTIELRDGSRVVGRTLEDTVSFHSGALGDMKLSWGGIRAVEYTADNNTARLTATNGDGFSIQIAGETLAVETGFGKTELPVKLIRSIKVTPPKQNVAVTAVAAGETGSRLTIELRDGSHVVGKGLDETLDFHSTAMGDLKLTWHGIRSIEYAAGGTDVARMTATNGDVYEVQFTAPAVRVETSFGKTELPVKLIRSIKVTAMTRPGQLPEGLVALWSGEGDGNDSVNGNNMTLTDITFSDGKVGQAFSFNGTSSYFKIQASPALNVGEGEGMTISAWIKPSDVDGLHPILEWQPGDKMPGSIGVQLWIGQNPGSQGVLCGFFLDNSGRDNNENHYVQIPSPRGTLVANTWQHIALTYSQASGVISLYVNGKLVAQRQWGSFVPLTKGDIASFRPGVPGNWTYDRFFAGLMDELAIYDRALSLEEIQAICTEQNNGEPLPPPPAPDMMPGIFRQNGFSGNGGGVISD